MLIISNLIKFERKKLCCSDSSKTLMGGCIVLQIRSSTQIVYFEGSNTSVTLFLAHLSNIGENYS